MLPGALSYVFHGKRESMLHTVDALVLRSVVLEHPLDILHQRDQQHIADEQKQADRSLDHRKHRVRHDDIAQKSRREIGQHHKDRHRHHNGKGDGETHHYLFRPFPEQLLDHRIRLGGLRLLLVIKAGGKGQTLHSQNQRIDKADHAADNGDLPQALAPGSLIGA